MGLDITAFENARIVDDNEQNADVGLIAYVNHDFPGRENSIVDGARYTSDNSLDFRAGSYGGYNQWRDQLAKLVGYSSAREVWNGVTDDTISLDEPFVALIDFADNEGVIGPDWSAKLAKNFDDFEDRAREVGDVFYEKYQLWRRAFHMAANNGFVDFG